MMAKRRIGPETVTLAAQMEPGSWKADDRTVDVCWYAGATVLRSPFFDDPYELCFDMAPGCADLSRLNAGAAVLDSHDDMSLRSQIGAVVPGSARIENGRGLATIRLSGRPEVAGIVQDVADGLIRNVSMGASIKERRIEKRQNGCDLHTATSWEVLELSLVPVQADPGASTLSHDSGREPGNEEDTMPTPEELKAQQDKLAALETENARLKQEAETARLKAERAARDVELDRIGATLKLTDLAVTLKASDKSLAECREALLNAKVKEQEAAGIDAHNGAAHVQVTGAGADLATEHAAEALCMRMDPGYKPAKPETLAAAKGWQSKRIARVIEDLAVAHGTTSLAGKSEREIVSLAMRGRIERLTHTTSDFPYLFGSALNKVLAWGYLEAPRTFEQWCSIGTTPDFKQISLLGLSEAADLVAVPEAGPYPLKSLSEAREVVTPAKYGHMLALTWEMMVNDDMSAFSDVGPRIRGAALRLEESTAYGILTTNANMRDGVALFHANHANLAGAAAISPTTIAELQGFIEVQTGLGALAKLNLSGRILVCTQGTARKWDQYLSPSYKPTSAANAVPSDQMGLKVVASQFASGTKFFLIGDPAQWPTVKFFRLAGYETPQIETIDKPENDSVIYKVRHVCAAKAVDWRNMAYNPGA